MKVATYGTIGTWEVCSMIKAPLGHLPLNESVFQDSSFLLLFILLLF